MISHSASLSLTQQLMRDYAMMGCVVGTVYLTTSLLVRWRTPSRTSKDTDSVASAAFGKFKAWYVVAFLLGLACEYVQASMTFALMRHEHGWSFGKIAEVYALGFAASWLTQASPAGDGAGGGQCLACLATYGAAGVLAARATGPRAVAASRVLAGVAQPLLQTSFDAWMRAAHADLGFPSTWRRSTYELAGTGTTVVSIVSGIAAEGVRRVFANDRRPFEIAACLAVAGVVVLVVKWPTLSAPARRAAAPLCRDVACLPTVTSCGRAGGSAIATVLTACVFESVAYVTNATWATALARVERGGRSPYGLVFALLMASAGAGTHLYQLAASAGAEFLARCLAASAGLAFGLLAHFEAREGATVANVLLPLFLFQLAAGCSVPVFAALRATHVPNDSRKPLSRASTALYGAIVIVLILLIPADTQLTFAICSALMACATLATLCL